MLTTRDPGRQSMPPLLIHGETVERLDNIKFLGTHVTYYLTWPGEEGSTETFFLQEAETDLTVLSTAC